MFLRPSAGPDELLSPGGHISFSPGSAFIGVTICRLPAIEGAQLHVAELDAVDGTPVLDIKPVMSEFLPREAMRQPEWSR